MSKSCIGGSPNVISDAYLASCKQFAGDCGELTAPEANVNLPLFLGIRDNFTHYSTLVIV